MRIVKETPDKVRIIYNEGSFPTYGYEKKYLCLGGPHNGERKATCQLDMTEYFGFNTADRHRWHKKIWVHQSLVPKGGGGISNYIKFPTTI
jgi:hypothetical protein